MSPHDRGEWPHNKCVELGPTVCMAATRHDGHPAGFVFCHDVEGFDERCIGSLNTDPHFVDRPQWEATGSLADGTLTLSPSVNCVEHSASGGHGWVRDGKWIPA